jgi:hypothetical protein
MGWNIMQIPIIEGAMTIVMRMCTNNWVRDLTVGISIRYIWFTNS